MIKKTFIEEDGMVADEEVVIQVEEQMQAQPQKSGGRVNRVNNSSNTGSNDIGDEAI